MRSARFLVVAVLSVLLVSCAPGPPVTDDPPPPQGRSDAGGDDGGTESPLQPTTASVPDPPGPAGPPESGWPNASNTGVPDGTELTPWEGECTITEPGTVIDAKVVDCNLRIRAADVVITRSRIHGGVIMRHLDEDYSFSISDSEIILGEAMLTGLGNGHYRAERVEVSGGSRSAYCAVDCTIEHSWVHAQSSAPDEEAHMSGIRMGMGTTLRFNTIVCEGTRVPPAAGCSAALTGYGDFSPISDNLVEGNLFQSGTASFCAFGGSSRNKPYSDDARDIRFINNVFERDEDGSCGIHAPIEAFDSDAPGNVWEGNVWDDGEPLPPRN